MIPNPRVAVDDEIDWNRDRALADAAAAGDRDAFGQLYLIHYDTVLRFAYYRVRSLTQAEDIVADAFLRAMRAIDNFTWTAGGFIGWLVTIARNLIADLYKSSRNRLEIPTGEMLDGGTTPGPEDIVIARITSETIHAAISSLNPNQRACIEARFLDQLSVAETAEAVGSNEGAVKTLQWRAVRSLSRDPRITPELIT